MQQILIDGLKRKLALIEHSAQTVHFLQAEKDLVNYLNTEEKWWPGINRLIQNDAIDQFLLARIVEVYNLDEAEHQEFTTPSFLRASLIRFDSEDRQATDPILEAAVERLTGTKMNSEQNLIFLYSHFIDQLISGATEAESTVPSFDEDSSILLFKGNKIKIAKGKKTKPHLLLSVLFREPYKEWHADEISEAWGEEYYKNDAPKIYQAAYSVNDKIAKETTIKDFLEISPASVRISKKYLSPNL